MMMAETVNNNPNIEKIEKTEYDYWKLKAKDSKGEEIQEKYNFIQENLHFYYSSKSKIVSSSKINSWMVFYNICGKVASKCKDNSEKQKRLFMRITRDTELDSQLIWKILLPHTNPYSLLPLSYELFTYLTKLDNSTADSDFQNELESYLNDQIKWFHFSNNNPNNLENSPVLLPAPWEHQELAIQLWEQNNYHGLIEMATGTGKTLAAFLAIEKLSKQLGRPPKVVVVSNTKILLTQWVDSFQKAFGFNEKASWFDTKTAQGIINENIEKLQYDLLIVDEIHNLMGPKFQKSLQIPAPFRIALSATVSPYHLGIIEKFIGKKVFSFDLKKAIKQGIIVPFKLIVYIVKLNPDEQEQYNGYSQELGILFTQASQQGITSLTSACSQIIKPGLCSKYWQLINLMRTVIHQAAQKENITLEIILELCKKKKVIVFFERVETIKDVIIPQLRNQGIDYYAVYGELNPNDIKNRVKAFRQANTGVLLGVKMINAGIDIPDADVGINAQFEKGRLQLIQRIGRLARKSWDKPNKYPYFYHIIAVSQKKIIENDEVNSIYLFSRLMGVEIEFVDRTSNTPIESDKIALELKQRLNITDRILFDSEPKERIEAINQINIDNNRNSWQFNSLIIAKWCDDSSDVRSTATTKVNQL
jgi:superfamily II DNA or RNA helicase